MVGKNLCNKGLLDSKLGCESPHVQNTLEVRLLPLERTKLVIFTSHCALFKIPASSSFSEEGMSRRSQPAKDDCTHTHSVQLRERVMTRERSEARHEVRMFGDRRETNLGNS